MKRVTAGPGDFGPPDGRDDVAHEALVDAVWEKLESNTRYLPTNTASVLNWRWMAEHIDDTEALIKVAYGE